jgi:membrane fusion protein (multidrug efflux system)
MDGPDLGGNMRVIGAEIGVGTVPGRPRRRGRRLWQAMIFLAAVSAAATYGAHWWRAGRFIESTNDAYVGGNVTAIAPHISGFIAKILVTDNQFVHAGDLLIELDNRDFRAAFDRADAVVAERDAALADIVAQVTQQELVVRHHEAEAAAAAARASFTAADATRYRSLVRASAATQQDAEKSRTAAEEAHAARDAAQAEVEAARQQLNILEARMNQARAAIRESEAALRVAALDLGYTELRAPIDGYVGDRAANLGAFVTAGTPLIAIVPNSGLWVDANFKEDQIAAMKPGQKATIIADVMPGHVIHGHLQSFAPATGAVFSILPAENATGNFTKIAQRVPVRVMLDGGEEKLGLLRPGLSTTVRIDTQPQSAP